MSISFIPALDQSTTLHLPLHPVHLTFSASFSTPEEYRTARNSGVRVELWSDIPQQHKPDGQWNALLFDWSTDSLVLRFPSEAVIHPWKTRFSFTYRLVYPSGQIKWLGDYGRNGTLVVDKMDERFDLASGWQVDQPALALVFKSTLHDLDLHVANLSENIDWAFWAFDNSNLPRLLSSDGDLLNINSALLVPSQSLQAIVPVSPILLTSQDATFSVTRSGSITIHASVSGTLSLQTPCLTDLKSYISFTAGLELLDCVSPYHIVILALSQKSLDVNPAHLSIISLSSSTRSTQFEIPLSQLRSKFPSKITDVALYSPLSSQARFVSTVADACTVTLGFGGSQWLVSPVYEFTRLDTSHVKLAVLAPHTRVITPIHTHRLPTPPPSPPFPHTQMQPLRFPEEDEEDAKLEHKSSSTEREQKQVTLPTGLQNVGLIRRLFNLYTGLIWWILRLLFRRLFAFKSKISTRITNMAGSGASTPVGRHKPAAPSRITGAVITTPPAGVTSKTVLKSPVIEQDFDEKAAVVKEVEDQKQDEHGYSPLTFDIPSAQGQILFVVWGHEDIVKGLVFGVEGKEDRFAASVERLSGIDGDTWLVELGDAPGRLTIR